MTTAGGKLRALFHGLEALYQTRSNVDPVRLVQSVSGGLRETLLMRESDDALELTLLLGDHTLALLDVSSLDVALSDEGLAESLPVLEGLSHLAYVVEAARRERPISALELETQAEVDKLAVVSLHRWPLDVATFEALVERLYVRFDLLPGSESLHARYLAANRLALRFSSVLRDHVRARRLADFRRTLRRFWHSSMDGKRALTG